MTLQRSVVDRKSHVSTRQKKGRRRCTVQFCVGSHIGAQNGKKGSDVVAFSSVADVTCERKTEKRATSFWQSVLERSSHLSAEQKKDGDVLAFSSGGKVTFELKTDKRATTLFCSVLEEKSHWGREQKKGRRPCSVQFCWKSHLSAKRKKGPRRRSIRFCVGSHI